MTTKKQISVGDLIIDIERKEIKNLHLAVYPPKGRVRIAAPLEIDDDAIRLFSVSKLRWIKKQRTRFIEQQRQEEREYLTGESHYFFGRRYLMNVRANDHRSLVKLRNKKFIDLYVPLDADKDKKKKVLDKWYREQLRGVADKLIKKWEKKMQVVANEFGIKRMKTKWGTCNHDEGRIWLNLELAKKPESCIEYIVVHEMTHLLERKHGDRFYALMDEFLPNWRNIKKELNQSLLGYVEWSEKS